MAKTAEKITDLNYDEIITLGVIEQDEDLRSIFTEEVKVSFNLLRSISKQGKINPETQILLRSIFDHVILTKKELIDKYLLLAETGGIPIEVTNPVDTEIIADITPLVSEDTEPKVKKSAEYKAPKEKIEKEIPRRYGKEKVLADIEKQGGKATPLQNTMLRINDLKNMYVNLSARAIKDMFNEEKMLSDVDCRDISSAIKIAEQKLERILRRKK
jgi:hypothetical protein